MTKEEKKIRNRILNEAPKRCVLEEVGNAVTHGVGAVIALWMFLLMLDRSVTPLMYMASIVYGVSMMFMMLMSCLYHSFKCGSKVKRLWRRFDYISIYLLIGGTYAPILLLYLGNTLGIVLFIIQWALILAGIVFVSIFGPGRIKWLHFLLYFLVGWSGILFIPNWISNELSLLFWILLGGVVYSLGMIPFTNKNIKSAHFIWHFFVLLGAITQWIGIYINLY